MEASKATAPRSGTRPTYDYFWDVIYEPYIYSLTYWVAALGVEICDLGPGFRDLTVAVLSE